MRKSRMDNPEKLVTYGT